MSRYRYITGERVPFEPAVTTLDGTHTQYCWGCGPDAPEGLGLRPRLDGTEPIADLEFDPRFEGGPGTVHGGAIAAFVDDLLGYVPVAYGAPAASRTGKYRIGSNDATNAPPHTSHVRTWRRRRK